jgi:Anti-sigma-K factor rskA
LNIQEYISSGIIERYLLGELSEKECAGVLSLSNQYPEIKKEIELVESTLMKISIKTPPNHLKQKILNKIELATTKTISLESKNKNYSYWVAAASIALLIFSAAYNFFLMNKLSNANAQLAVLQSEKDVFAKNFEVQAASYEALAYEMEILKLPENKKIILSGLEISPNSLAAIYWNQKTQEVYINVNFLPIPATEKQYQLWAIVEGKPVDAGVFESSGNIATLQKMNSIVGATAFAVTLEKKGGNPTPNMEAMYLLGNV